jgi:hypothetical protein
MVSSLEEFSFINRDKPMASYQSEQRREKRRKQSIFFDILPIEGRERVIQAVTTDISASGAGIIINRRLPLGTAIVISSDGMYNAHGTIVNLCPSDISGLIRAGVHFTKKDYNWPW